MGAEVRKGRAGDALVRSRPADFTVWLSGQVGNTPEVWRKPEVGPPRLVVGRRY